MQTEPLEILIVEDSLTQAAQLRGILERNHFRARLAGHGAQALEALQKRLPRLVISDIIMPGMDGYELCRRVKTDPATKHLPVILLTSLSNLKDVVKGLECGADSFVVKPYEEQHLLSRIQYILANQELRAQRRDERTLELFFGGHSHILSRLPNVENAIDLLLGAYETLVEKNTALSQAKKEAERANRAKSEFLSRMSHELRTPMNAILGFAQILEMEERDSQKREGLDQILKGGKHLLELINEVLDISRIEAGRLSVSTEPVRVNDIVRECVDLIAPLAATRHLRIDDRSTAGAKRRHIIADRQRLKQVVLNLLSNAVKYNREGGSITVACEDAEAGRMRIKISDTGEGIAAGDLPRLFQSFERLGADRTGVAGTGLGLALSKRLIELMGGSVGVESVVGEGSTFWIEMPVSEAHGTSEAGKESEADSTGQAGAKTTCTVLYIEDNLSNLKLVERILGLRHNVKLISAMQGGLGLDLAREHLPTLILLDLDLPDIPGREVLARLRAEKGTSECPVVVISADATPSEIARLRSAGARDYLTKPLDVKQFLGVIDDILAQSRVPPDQASPGFIP